MMRIERLKHSAESLVGLSEDRSAAWILAVAGVLVTALCWYVALAMPDLVVSVDEFPGGRSRAMVLLIVFVTIAGPFLAVRGALTLLSREDATSDESGSDPTFNFMVRARADRQRRVLLTAAIAGVANLFLLYVVSQ
jgi:hypothetical protein